MANYVAMMKMRTWMKELMEVKIIKLEKTNHNNSKLITMTKMTMNNRCSDEKNSRFHGIIFILCLLF
jgi:hypothetical protein